MEDLGFIAQLWRYPVKSFQGEPVASLAVAPGGATGDRGLAVVDRAAGKVLSAKAWAQLLEASARLDDTDGVIITLPGGSELAAADPDVHAALSTWLDRDVYLDAPPTDAVLPMEMHTGWSDEDTPLFDWPGPPGTWVDLADAHWLTTASLAAAAALHPHGQWDVRRFRPTALIDGPTPGWAEDAWTTIALGEVHSEVLMPTPRCSMPSRAQPGLERDLTIGTTIRDSHANNLGVYASIVSAGILHTGDEVHTR